MPPSEKDDLHEITSRVKIRFVKINQYVDERDEDFRRRKEQYLDTIIWQEIKRYYNGAIDNIDSLFRKIKEYFSKNRHI